MNKRFRVIHDIPKQVEKILNECGRDHDLIFHHVSSEIVRDCTPPSLPYLSPRVFIVVELKERN